MRIMGKCGDEIGFLAEEMRKSSVREMNIEYYLKALIATLTWKTLSVEDRLQRALSRLKP